MSDMTNAAYRVAHLCPDEISARAFLDHMRYDFRDFEVRTYAGSDQISRLSGDENDVDLIVVSPFYEEEQAIALAENLSRYLPHMRALVVARRPSAAFVRSCLAAGARGCVDLEEGRDIVLGAVLIAAAGGVYTPWPGTAANAERAIASFSALRAGIEGLGMPGSVTPRERNVLTELARGLSNKEIARALNLAETTVKSHIAQLMLKLRARNRTQLALTAASFEADRVIEHEAERASVYRDLLQQSPIGSSALIREGQGWRPVFISRNITDILGYSWNDLMSGRVEHLSIVHPDDRERVLECYERHCRDGPDKLEIEMRIVAPGGEVREVTVSETFRRGAANLVVQRLNYVWRSEDLALPNGRGP